jgi:crotonobetainyl-CoA:carnitine CoA-transferase CaiB-like acyl-CoA transferase
MVQTAALCFDAGRGICIVRPTPADAPDSGGTMLSPYRVLDLTDNRGALGPMILADLGADVLKIEPPGGSAARAEASHFAAYNRNKRSVSLDLGTSLGRDAFLELVAGSEFLFENAKPGEMASRGLGWEQLREVNPRLIYVATTPFGQTGPYANHLATDLTLAAMGGMMAVNGDADRAPVRVSVPQCWRHAATESAVGALVAHHLRQRTGQGRFVDVSVQSAVFWTGLQAMIASAIQGKDMERAGTALQLGPLTLPLVYPCKDGEVVLIGNGPTLVPLVRWMVDDGVVPEAWLTAEEWPVYDMKVMQGQPLAFQYAEVVEAVSRWTARYTKQELLERGLATGVTMAPVATLPELLDFAQLSARNYWTDLEVQPGLTLKGAGPFVKASAKPILRQRGVPRPGEHTAATLAASRQSGGSAADGAALPLAGLKVADFSWIGVGPITGKYLADHGAEVIRIETANPPDRLRVAGPFKDGVFGPNRSQFYGAFNTSKRSIAVNIKTAEGQAIAKKLIDWADVVLESFTPGTMAAQGLGYSEAKALNPDVIYVSTCLMGQTGPAASLAGYGYHAAAICGFYEVTGWPDRPPGGPFTAYTDTIAPRFLAAAVLAAIDHHRRTGEGQHIEQSQMETSLYFLAPEVLDQQISGRVPRRSGNDDPDCSPHGAYPTRGEDKWIAIAIEGDHQWKALCSAMGEAAWATSPECASDIARRRNANAIDQRIAAWTREQDAHQLMQKLQKAGIPAGAVQRSSDHLRDPQLAHRGFFHPLEHGEMGTVPYEGHQFVISGYPSGPRSAAPCLGAHSMEVLLDVLGLSEEEVAELAAGLG